ncbi:MAG: DUF2784 domain-containing protein [Gammaproteobacteria bacterium]|nr:MAG: DUF2784 domain-containing protein [Gammaproteobacteria bacterium]
MQNEAINPDFLLLLAADAILLLHVLFVAFVIVGLVLIIFGGLRGWYWVRNLWFRVSHLIAIGIVVVQSWFGVICPLTIWEMALRPQAEGTTHSGTFISYWLGHILYYQLPPWVFVVSYTVFGVLVVACWLWVRPRPFG